MVPRIFLPWNPFHVHLKIFHQGSSPTVPGCSADLRKVGNDSTDVNNNLTVNLNIDHNINLIIDQNIDHTIDLTQTEGGEEDADSGTSQPWSTNCASMQFPTYLILFIAYLCKVNKCHSQSICNANFAYIDLSGSSCHISNVELPYTSLSACLQVVCRCENDLALVTFGPN